MKQLPAVKALSAIAHNGRLTLMKCLIKAGPEGVPAGELAAIAKVGATTASAQLLVLSNAGLVTSQRNGRRVTYFANYEAMRDLMSFMMVDCCAGRDEICTPVMKACCA